MNKDLRFPMVFYAFVGAFIGWAFASVSSLVRITAALEAITKALEAMPK